ncbi:hypothetical protein [Helcococcus massiliensis]|uniref:hypothetical protein n=1 Tax=Helcococcus massiliensis TaxID=2040290 RepID=UPI000CDE6AAE|nr:hypothetical protein [Helcococcus massiliensis]
MKKKLLQITSLILILTLTACSSKKETVHEESNKETLVESKEETTKETKEETLKETEKNTMDSLVEKEIEAGKMVVTGQVRVFSEKELAKYQNLEQLIGPNPNEKYVVMILDKAVDITVVAGDGDGYRTRPAELIDLPLDLSKYNEQTIIISFSPDDGHWQSDASLPMNAPRMGYVKVLK